MMRSAHRGTACGLALGVWWAFAGGTSAAQEPTPSLTVSTVTVSEELPSLGRLGGVSMDDRGNLYVSNFGASLWRVRPDGTAEKLAEDLRGSSGNATLPDGRVLQASFLENRIVEIGPDGGERTFADERLDGPVGLAAGPDGTVYVCNCRGNSVTAVAPDGSSRVLAAGPPFDCPNGVTVGADGRPHVVNFNDSRVIRLDPASGATEILAELPEGRNAHIAFAGGAFYVTRIASGELYRVDGDGSWRKVLGTGEAGLTDGAADSARLAYPNGIAASPDGRFLYLNNLDGPWREDVPTRMVIRRVGPLPASGPAPGPRGSPADEREGPSRPRAGELERIEIAVGDMVFDALAAGPADGPTVLLLHGFPQTSYAFRHQLRALGALGFRAVAPDQRGYSPRARPDGVEAYAMARLSRDVVDIADALGADDFHLVGHDWGGAVAWVVASRWPDRVRTLTVLSTPHYAALGAARAEEGSDQARRSSYFTDFAAPGAEKRFLADDAAYLRSLWAGLEPAAVEEYLAALGSPDALGAALAWYAAAFGPSSRPTPPGASSSVPPARPVTVPTLYVWSTEDGAFGRAAAEATRDWVTGPYRFEVLEGVGHWVAEEAPEAVTRLIVEQLLGHATDTAVGYRRARLAVLAAREALGGDAVDAVEAVAATFTGTDVFRGQSARPGPPFDSGPVAGRLLHEEGGRTLTELNLRNPGGTDRSYRRVLGEERGWNLWIAREFLTELPESEVARLRRIPLSNVALLLPHSLVRAALAEPASLRWVGRSGEGSDARSRVALRLPGGPDVTLVVDDEGVPRAAEWMVSDARQGDAVYTVAFSDYRTVGGLRLPHGLELRAGDEEDLVLRLGDVTVNPAVDDTRFSPPEGIDPPPQPPAFRPRAVADGVFALRLYTGPANSYNSLLVQLDDQTVVVEPVLVDLFARPVTGIARTLAEQKPIRWVVATHHHSDHIGGARGYLASGARLATTPHGAEVVRRMASARSTLTPNPVVGRDIEGQLVEVGDRLTIGAGSRTVELFRVAPSPHAEEMLLVYVPHAKTVYVADLFAVPETGVYPPTALTRHFARALDDLGLDVETIVPAHGLVGTRADLDVAMAADPPTPPAGTYDRAAPGSR